MTKRDYSAFIPELADSYARHAPSSAAIHQRALQVMVDGGSHTMRMITPFPPRIRKASGAWIEDEDGNRILDFWQGHYANILGHNPPFMTDYLAQVLAGGYGLQTGFEDACEIELGELICRQTGQDLVRFTTSGTLATMYAVILARAYTQRQLVLKIGGGWHGSQPWGLKGVHWRDGLDHVESRGIPRSVSDQVVLTGFNNPAMLHEKFRRYGDQLACFIVEPVIGAGGLMPAQPEFLQLARQLTADYGVILIFDEVISGFRFRAGDVGRLYHVRPDMVTLGKAIGGGTPVAAIAGSADLLNQAGRAGNREVAFSGGTYSAHPLSMMAARHYVSYLVQHESEVYETLAEIGSRTRAVMIDAFAREGIPVRFAGDRNQTLPPSSLHMPVFPYEPDLELNTPEEVLDPNRCDTILTDRVLQLALLTNDVHVVHGLGATSTAHSADDLKVFGEALRRVAHLLKPYF